MTELTLLQWVAFFLVCISATCSALWLAGLAMSRRQRLEARGDATAPTNQFLFDQENLVDHDVNDVALENANITAVEKWSDLRQWLLPRFEGLPHSLADAPDNQTITLSAKDAAPGSSLNIQRFGAHSRISLSDDSAHSAAAWHDALTTISIGSSADATLQAAPDPIWRTDDEGRVIWKNAACDKITSDQGELPFIDPDHVNPNTASNTRIAVEDEQTGKARWYELRSLDHGSDHLHFANDITQVIQAETVQRSFVQTLTKTFANLTTGLAIFDKTRQLALFNPALVDLTGVDVPFLSARPDLMNFFDQLRERQVLPEPKNYANWRAQIRDVVAQADDGLYQELWTLPTGLTYRVTGRPHPDGAVAFLFEDISAEISLTRRFRTQIELRQAVLDGLDDAVAIIAPSNVLMFCNQPCTDLLGVDPDTSFADMSLQDLLAACRSRFGTSRTWTAFEQKVLSAQRKQHLRSVLPTNAGEEVTCQVKPLTGGSKMLIFSVQSESVAPQSLSAAS